VSGIYVSGLGAVSPAGWGVPAFRSALDQGVPIPPKPVARPGWDNPLMVREVPSPTPRPAFFAHPRVRRASPITLYAAGAALEAMESAGVSGENMPARLGLVMCILAGCVRYSHRFFDETLKDPATASPLIFPETVFNAPASHVSALLGRAPETCTLLGDPSTFLQGMALGADWLLEGRVDGCLVVGAEETNWLLADVLWHFDHGAVLGGGAGAVCLTRGGSNSPGVELALVTDGYLFTTRQDRAQAARRMRAELPPSSSGELLCDSLHRGGRADAAETEAWKGWSGARISPKTILGDGLMASGGWQCVAACDALLRNRFQAANVSVVGHNQQAIGARFIRNPS